jgi:cyclic pyranopterin phosphate synthase
MPLDSFGRDIHYLRISVTDRCNLRCVYCMPLGNLQFLPGPDLLSAEEIERVVAAAVAVGFRRFRLTGGEPLLRADLADIVARITRVAGQGAVSMTTNGILLPGLLPDLVRAGLRRVNLHIDTLHPERLQRIMRFATLPDILAGIAAVEAQGLLPLKLNAVVTRGLNDEDVVELARMTLTRDCVVRLIEMMPLGDGECSHLAESEFVSSAESMARITAALGELSPLPMADPHDEARNYRLPGARGIVGFISPVSRPYCGSCNRMRLTAHGRFHLCLLRDDQLDVRAALRGGADQRQLEAILLQAVGHKPVGHALAEGVHTRVARMHAIGG